MTEAVDRLRFSLDLLIGQAKKRTRRRRLRVLLVAILIGGATTAAALALSQGAHAGNPFAIRRGMTAHQVRGIAGAPYRTYVRRLGEYQRIRARDLTNGRVVRTEECWSYHATKRNTGIFGLDACFSRGRVLDVLQDLHLLGIGP